MYNDNHQRKEKMISLYQEKFGIDIRNKSDEELKIITEELNQQIKKTIEIEEKRYYDLCQQLEKEKLLVGELKEILKETP